MSRIEPDGEGQREKGKFNGENCYHICTIGDDGWIHFACKLQDENKVQNQKLRELADELCKAHGKMINRMLGNVGRPKEKE